jgi:hypothetical protein
MENKMYNYTDQRNFVFTEEGVNTLLKIQTNANSLLKVSGAFSMDKVTSGISGSSFDMMACLDYLVEKDILRHLDTNYKYYTWA